MSVRCPSCLQFFLTCTFSFTRCPRILAGKSHLCGRLEFRSICRHSCDWVLLLWVKAVITSRLSLLNTEILLQTCNFPWFNVLVWAHWFPKEADATVICLSETERKKVRSTEGKMTLVNHSAEFSFICFALSPLFTFHCHTRFCSLFGEFLLAQKENSIALFHAAAILQMTNTGPIGKRDTDNFSCFLFGSKVLISETFFFLGEVVYNVRDRRKEIFTKQKIWLKGMWKIGHEVDSKVSYLVRRKLPVSFLTRQEHWHLKGR